MNWDLQPPENASLRDNEVSQTGNALSGKKVCLLICGSIAAYKGPDIIRELRKEGADVTAVVSSSALDFVTPMALEWTSGNKPVIDLTADAEHLGGDKTYDLYIVAPASYNTINKFAAGIADSPVLITLSSALGLLERKSTRIFISPCMHGSMHNSILTTSMKRLQTLGVTILKPRQEDGKNKLPEPHELVKSVIQCISTSCN